MRTAHYGMVCGSMLLLLAMSSAGCGRTIGADSAVCGDGVLQGQEQCDGTDLGGQTCESVGYSWGELACGQDCLVDDSGCGGGETYCGNGVVEGDEECDLWELEGADCRVLGFDAGELYCAVDCTFETAQCSGSDCGDGVVGSAEPCDDGNTSAGDGCDDCGVEAGWQCHGSPSVCCSLHWQGPGCTGPCVVFVDAASASQTPDGLSWSTAFARIQDGVDAAYDVGLDCEVWVAEGTYRSWETDVTDTLQLRAGTLLYGGFAGTETARQQRDWEAHPTVIDGRSANDPADRVRHVVSALDVPWATLDGFVVTGGDATDYENGDSTELELVSGAGLYVDGSEVGVASCRFEDNRAGRGGALAVNEYAEVMIQGCRFVSNRALDGGAVIVGGFRMGTATLKDSFFERNEARRGGAVHCDQSGTILSISGSTFEGNTGWEGGAVYQDGDVYSIADSMFADNQAFSGGAIYYDHFHSQGYPVSDVVFVGNSAERGGAILLSFGSYLRMQRVQFVGNSATGELPSAGAVHGQSSTHWVDLESVVFSANRAVCGSGALHTSGLYPGLMRTIFVGNSAGACGSDPGAGAYTTTLYPSLVHDCFFVGNHGVGAGAVSMRQWHRVFNSTFVANVADVCCGAVDGLVWTGSFNNNIVWANEAPQWPQIRSQPGGEVSHCLVQGGFDGPGNLDVDPQFVGYPTPVYSGSWATVDYNPVTYQTRLEDPGASWAPGELVGLFLKPTASDPRWLWIADNDATGILVWADMTGWVGAGDAYALHDLRLSATSPAIDTGDDETASATDFYGNARVDVVGVGSATTLSDIGAHEFQP